MTGKILIGAAVVVLLGVGGYFFRERFLKPPPAPTPVVEEQPPVLSTYASSTLGFSIQYPPGYILDEAYAYEGVPKKPILGVKFLIPGTTATGTNLSSFDTGVSVETLPRAKSCTGDIYVLANVKPTKLTEQGVEYSIATTSEGAAGNRYEEMVYALVNSNPCIAVRYFIHSTNLDNYPTSTVHAFDRSKLLQEFDTIRRSLVRSR